MKTALIMEGGAMRGMFSCGVTDVFMENDITFDGGAGISAGAVFGCNVKSRQIGRAIRYNKKYCRDPRYCSVRSLIKTGDLYNREFCYETLPVELDPFDAKTFSENPMEFYIGATDIETGKAVFHRCTDGGADDLAWMRASASMPFVSNPVEIGGHLYLDGGIVVSIPFRFMEKIGYERNVIILTQPKGFVKKKMAGQKSAKILYRDYPALTHAMAVRHKRYMKEIREIDEREAAGFCLVIRPPCALGISRTEKDPKELQRVYELGRAEAEKNLDAVKAFLEKQSKKCVKWDSPNVV